MLLNVRLQNFRSYKDISFEFETGVNIIVGPNASGKTNLLESMTYLLRGKSFRSKDQDILLFGTTWARIDGFLDNEQRVVKFVVIDSLVKREFEFEGKKMARLNRQFVRPVVVFEPNHLLLLHGPPEGRRNFLDAIIEQKSYGYAKLTRDYKKALVQRNTLLKNGMQNDNEQLFVWNIRLSELGGQIAERRYTMIEQINKVISNIYSRIAATSFDINVLYDSACNIENYSSSMMKKLEQHQHVDFERGFTGVGPHRDDVLVYIGGQSASQCASRGEVRTLLLSLKIFELDNIENWSEKKPILLLDDVFSELDGTRRRALTDYLNKYQTFITTTDADILSHKLVDNSNVILF